MTRLVDSFNGDKVDLGVTFVQPPADPKHDPAGRVIRVEVKAADIEEFEYGITLKAHNSTNLLGVFIPWRMVLGIDFMKEYDNPGQYI